MLLVKTVLNFERNILQRKKSLKRRFLLKNINLISLQVSQFPTVLLAKTLSKTEHRTTVIQKDNIYPCSCCIIDALSFLCCGAHSRLKSEDSPSVCFSLFMSCPFWQKIAHYTSHVQ